MSRLKKWFCILMACALVVKMLPAPVVAVDAEEIASGTCGNNLTWSLDEDGVLKINGTGEMANYYDEPDSVPNLSVAPWYEERSKIKEVIVGSSVTSIGDWAFYSCENLINVDIPEGITKIGIAMFSGCYNLKALTLPKSLETIGSDPFNYSGLEKIFYAGSEEQWKEIGGVGDSLHTSDNGDYAAIYYESIGGQCGVNAYWSFVETTGTLTIDGTGDMWDYPDLNASPWYGIDALASAEVGSGITSIGHGAFNGCSGLTSITIPDGITSIGNSAFNGCSGLTGITIPDSVTSIEGNAFGGCSNLTGITIPDGVTSIAGFIFYGCSSLTNIAIPNSVTSIEHSAFYGCSGLTSITIPDGVTSIGNYAFYDCSSLTSITIPNGVTSIGDSVFSGCSSLTRIEIPDSITSIGRCAFFNCSGLTTNIEIPNVTSIGDSAFYGCSSLTRIEISNNVTSIGENAFHFCSGLMSIEIPNSITSIAGFTFYGCSSLTSMTIPDGVTSIGNYAFSDCNGLTSIEIPNSVTSIGDKSFIGCGQLENVYYSGSRTEWLRIGEESENSDIGDGVLKIGDAKMAIVHYGIEEEPSSGQCGDTAYWNYDISTGTLEITGSGEMWDYLNLNAAPWYGIDGITSVRVGSGITGIGNCAFSECINLRNVSIASSVTRIGSAAFSGCSRLTNIEIPRSVTTIGGSAFYGCGLTGITIPVSVTTIMERAFYNCLALSTVDYAGSREDWLKLAESSNNTDLGSETIKTGSATTAAMRYGLNTISLAGGEGVSGSALRRSEVAVGTQVSLPTNPFRKTGSSFCGWLCDVDGLTYQEGETYTMPAQDVTFTATWSNVPYTVTFTGGTGAEGTAPVQEATIMGDRFNLPENPFTRTDYTFSGWLCNSDRQRYQPGAAFTMPARDVTFTAEWDYSGTVYTLPDAYRERSYIMDLLDVLGPDAGDVVFRADGLPRWLSMTEDGLLSGTPGSTGEVSFTVTLSARPASEAGWAIGYAEERAAEGTFHFRLTVRESSLTVSFDSGGGIGTMEPVNVRYADDYTLPSSTFTASEEGSAFGGWFYDGKLYPAGSVLRVIGDINLKAYWHPAPSVTLELSELSSAVLHVPYNVKLAEIACKDFSFDEVVFLYVDGLPGWLSIEDGKLFGLPPKTGREEFSVIATVREGEKIYTAAIKISLTIKMNSKENVNNEIDEGYKVIKPVPDMKEAIASQVFISEGAYARFVSVYLNGRELIRGMEYTAREGSTVITISEQTLKTVGTGTHTIAATFKSTDSMNTLRRSAQNFTIGTLQTSSPSGGNSGGGGGGGSASSAVSIPSFANGSVKCKSTKAIKGTVVALMVSPDSGFILSSLTVLDSSGKEVTLTRKNTNEYTFIMPASAVSVSASFVPAQSAVIPENTGIQFNDVSPESWYYEPVKWALENGITKGVKKNEFAPDQGCTRAQLITFLWNAAGMPEPEGEGKEFWDVAQDTYYAKAVQWASAQGITNGVGGRAFAPDRTISRGDAVNMLYSMAGKPKVDTENTFRDVDMRYETAVLWASNNGVTSYKKKFSPSSNCTRAQIVTFLYRMRDK